MRLRPEISDAMNRMMKMTNWIFAMPAARPRDAEEAEETGDQCDDQEDDGVVQHGTFLVRGSSVGSRGNTPSVATLAIRCLEKKSGQDRPWLVRIDPGCRRRPGNQPIRTQRGDGSD